MAIWRTDCYGEILAREGGVPAHPHNSYLEIVLDSGLIGLVIVVGLLLMMGRITATMLRIRWDKLTALSGGLGLVAIVNTLILGLSSNFFYPKQSMLWLICAIALTIRVRSTRPLLQTNGDPPARRSVGQLTRTATYC